jgi:hypothetical protein
METILSVLPEYVEVEAFLPKLVNLLSDKDELKLQSHSVLSRICVLAPSSVLGSVDLIIDPLEKTVNKKPNSATPLVGPEGMHLYVQIYSIYINAGVTVIYLLSRVRDLYPYLGILSSK